MKIFVISLKRSINRRKSISQQLQKLDLPFEFIDAVDGLTMDANAVKQECTGPFYKFYLTKPWITEGVIATAMSHRLAYKKIVDEQLDYALILEDDVMLSKNFPHILSELENHLDPKRLISFFCQNYIPNSPLQFDNASRIPVTGEFAIYQPVSISEIGSAACYIMSNYTAKRNLQQQTPIANCPDWWDGFINNENYEEFRFVYPLVMKPGGFESTINYIETGGLISRSRMLISRIPVFRKWIESRRVNRFMNYMLYEFV